MILEFAIMSAISLCNPNASMAKPQVVVVDVKCILQSNKEYGELVAHSYRGLSSLREHRRTRAAARIEDWELDDIDGALARHINSLLVELLDIVVQATVAACHEYQVDNPGVSILYTNVPFPVLGFGCEVCLGQEAPPKALDITKLIVERIDKR